MYKICKTESTTKRQIEVETALYELLKKKDFEDITVTELCATVNMPRKTFYRYFDEKEDVINSLLDRIVLQYGSFFNENKNRNYKNELEDFYRFWYDKKELLDIICKNRLMINLFECASRFPINDIISVSKYLPDETEWARKKIFEYTVFALLFNVISWYKEGYKSDISDMVDITSRILCGQLFPSLKKDILP